MRALNRPLIEILLLTIGKFDGDKILRFADNVNVFVNLSGFQRNRNGISPRQHNARQ